MVRARLSGCLLMAAVLFASGCSRNSDRIDGPTPVLDAVTPDLVCVEQAERTVDLTGEGFAPLVLDAATDRAAVMLPEVFVLQTADLFGQVVADAQEVQVPQDQVTWQSQQAMQILLKPELGLAPGAYRVRVRNGSGRECMIERGLTVVPPPTLEEVAPDLLCLEQGGRELTLSGEGFIDNDGVLPLVQVGDLALTADAVDGCVALEGPAGAVRSCTSLTVTLEQDALPAGVHAVSVTNPDPAGCSSEQDVSIAVVPGPVAEAVEPELFCGAQQDTGLIVHGTGFLRVDGALPTVEVDGQEYNAESASDCTPLDGTTLQAESCLRIAFTLPAGILAAGWYDLQVQNPPPAACVSTLPVAFYHLDAPAIAAVGPTTPCDQNATDFTIVGEGFLDLDGQAPAVILAGAEATVDAVDGCVEVENVPGARLCTSLQVSVPDPVGLGTYSVTVTNPGDPACSDSTESSIGLPPVVSSVEPIELCASGGTFTVHGERFADGAVVSIANQEHQADLETTFVDEQTLTAVVPDPTPEGTYDVTVTNPDGCSHTLEDALIITPLPVVYFVDPVNLYNGVNIQVIIYTSGILGSVSEVLIWPAGQPANTTALDFVASSPERIQAVVPAGLAPGDYSVSVTDDLGCVGALENAFHVAGELTVAIDRVELPFGWTEARTGVNVYSPEEPGDGMTNFQPTPRFYLNPTEAGPAALASELKHTAYVSPLRASSAVPAGLPLGMYDLIAVNPDGGIGLLEDAFEVTELPPPVIDGLAPASVVNQDLQQTAILGDNFRNPAFGAECLQPDDTIVPLAGDILSSDATSILVELDFVSQTIQDGSICIVTVTNDDGTYALYSALGVTNPSLNLEFFAATTPMNVGRRAPCALAGDAAPGARFVYALGGDDGTTQDSTAGTYYDSIEMAAIDPYGDLGDWSVVPYRLPEPRSFHACTSIGRYLYVVGGNGGAGAEANVWRARILDPADAPEIDNVGLDVDPEAEPLLAPGRYSYRVSALMPADDPDNPGGETLAGDPFQIQTPDIEERITITIAWTPVPGAVGFRVYRTPDPDTPSGNEVLIGETDGATRAFSDDGSATPGSEIPLPLGAPGRFAQLPSLSTAREGAGIVQAVDPDDASIVYIYVLGGRDQAAEGLASVERLDVQLQADGSQTFASQWVTEVTTIGSPRWQLQAYAADDRTAPDIVAPAETWIYASGGIRDDLQYLEPEVWALRVSAGGALGAGAGERYEVDEMQPFRAGYAPAIFNNQIFAFGGNQGMASLESSSIEMCGIVSGACSASIPDPPDLANWNSLGIDLTVPRYLASSVTASAFIFLVGGIDDSVPPQPLAATEKTLW